MRDAVGEYILLFSITAAVLWCVSNMRLLPFSEPPLWKEEARGGTGGKGGYQALDWETLKLRGMGLELTTFWFGTKDSAFELPSFHALLELRQYKNGLVSVKRIRSYIVCCTI